MILESRAGITNKLNLGLTKNTFLGQGRFEKSNSDLSYLCSIMFNPGLYFQTLDLTKSKVLLNLGLESFVIRAKETQLDGVYQKLKGG